MKHIVGLGIASCLIVSKNDVWNVSVVYVLIEKATVNVDIEVHHHKHMGHLTLLYGNEIEIENSHRGFDRIYMKPYGQQLLLQINGHIRQLDEKRIAIIVSLPPLIGRLEPLFVFQCHH